MSFRGEAPVRVLVSAHVSDCRTALAATEPVSLSISYEWAAASGGSDEPSMDGRFVSAVPQLVHRTCS